VKRNKLTDIEESWLIVVKVGGDGAEVNIVMQPNSKIRQLHAKVQAECGVRGKFWPVSVEGDGDEIEPLRLESTMQECGLFHKAVVWLELETTFCAERDALIALRDACMQNFTSPASKWATSPFPEESKTCLAWSNLESFTSPDQLAICYGVKVLDGHVTELFLSNLSLTGNSTWHCQFCLGVLICDLLGPIPKEIGQLTDLRKCRLGYNQLSGSQDTLSDVQKYNAF
jgi:hypothetical protein